MTEYTKKTPGFRLTGNTMELTPLQYVAMFIRVYALLWGVSAAAWVFVKITCLDSLLDIEGLLNFRLPDAMFSRLTPSPTHEYRAEVPKTR